jgi:subtilisin family serine protease
MPGVTGAKSADSSTYIVVFHEDQDPEAAARGLQRQYGVEASGIYRYALKGAVIHATSRQALEIERDGRVDFIELNQVYSIDAQTVPTGIDRVFAPGNSMLYIDETDDRRVDADVAVLDTGIDIDHPDLNLAMAIDCTWSGPREGTCAGTRDDGHGHGTHVAGTVGALDNDYGVVGVAPGVRLWAVKVLTNYGTGTTAQVVAGVEFVAEHADQIEVANMSLSGGGESEAMDTAISTAVGLGVTFVLSAGNSAADVSGYHPAGHPDAITVSALADFDGLPGSLGAATCRTDVDDTLAYFSNYGADVTMIGPGICIYSTYQDGGYATMSGTSMSAPHVAGAAALLASQGGYTPGQIRDTLTAEGNYDWVDEAPDGIQEPLLDLGNEGVFAPAFKDQPLPISLTGNAYKVGKKQFADLSWTPTGEGSVDIYRDGALHGTTENDGFYTDEIARDDAARIHFYWICEAGTDDTCSASLILYCY